MRLLITADDLGLDENVTRAALHAHRAGVVSSAALLVNMPASAAAARLARREAALEVGLHLNITEGKCTASPARVDLLADHNGNFRLDPSNPGMMLGRLREMIEKRPEVIDQIVVEFESQVERFRGFGLSLAHLNAHHFVPLIHPLLYSAYVRFAESVDAPYRGWCEPILHILELPDAEMSHIRAESQGARVPSPSVSLSSLLDPSGEPDIRAHEYVLRMEQRLRELVARDEIGSVEIVTHPALPATRHPHAESYAQPRELETALVQSAEFLRAIREMGFQIGGYSSLFD